ncbi:MAG TPA: gliding motility-associated ABC transporter ATP-binding subunit GldA [Chitinophagales bacterium]|jgi:ABC-2 type transport system ATP-binding protein|nr:gliding motility-associated ABC transporter ATP-binding subunit GldA [Chitinophagales bacterium]HPA35974.1 gliding motility-associated ABC transporter ATP-binding subunit GldA [Chitinophagales bacterium]HQD11738.1 gliding motility-associated ABC transporter ATP-binding subunit GldA [Chitinophagales bacterium]HQO31927.1 gliding motility-associated ABC transporter ATP-binding subunit GldA [Chitinophagales bacterium]HQO90151.1 gliding motility-associated ABC transporter ATP-binding subunit GldA
MSISVQQLSKTYGEQKAVDAISFEVKKGEILGFLGPNGAGKSTTMKMLTGYLPPSSGTALLNKLDIVSQPLEVKRCVGYLPENNPLYYDMYVKEFLAFIHQIHLPGDKQMQKNIQQAIELVGLQAEQHKKIGQLSKGYKQRVGLAQALLHHPDILILDEPTTGLDPNQLADIRQLIKDLGKEKTIIFSTHIMQEVEAVCDRVIIISKGRLVADDRPGNLQSRLSGSVAVEVEFAAPASADALRQLELVHRIDTHSETHFTLHGKDSIQLRKDLFAWAVSQHNPLLTIKQETKSLEDIFQQLTANAAR